MLGKNFSLLFFLKKPKNYESGEMPIYLRITVDGKGKEMATGRHCEPRSWIQKAGKMFGKTENAKELNNYLTSLQVKVFEARRILMEENLEICAESLKNLLTGQGEKPKMILDVFQQHNDQMRELVNQEFAPGTLQRYTTSLKHTRDFISGNIKGMIWKYVNSILIFLLIMNSGSKVCGSVTTTQQ